MGSVRPGFDRDWCHAWLEHALTQCADALPGRRDAFLWNVRRCAEALCIACVLDVPDNKRRGTDKDQKEPRLEEMISLLEREGLSKSVLPSLKSMQLNGNLGAHVQAEGWDVSTTKAREGAGALRHAVQWYFEDHRKRALPGSVRAALDRIDAALTDPSRPVPPESPPQRRASTARLAAGAIGCGLLGALLMRLASAPTASEAASRTAVRPGASLADAPTLNPATAVAPTAPVPVPVPPITATPRPCPVNSAEIPNGPVQFDQPHPRPTWPRAGPARPGASTTRRCMDAAPVTAEQYGVCVREGSCAPPLRTARAGCAHEGSGAEAAGCVTQAQAADYCRVHGGELPSMAEWEHLLRLPARRTVRVSERVAEWGREPFPAEVLQRGPAARCDAGPCGFMTRHEALAGSAGWSWNHANAGDHRPTLGFRCVRDP
ncbi:MAG: hypothetical protein HY909_21305 [Deltaproteobacteria bacterium]|nr:hypothetical protein [Deltaproteobacteria bacterium]